MTLSIDRLIVGGWMWHDGDMLKIQGLSHDLFPQTPFILFPFSVWKEGIIYFPPHEAIYDRIILEKRIIPFSRFHCSLQKDSGGSDYSRAEHCGRIHNVLMLSLFLIQRNDKNWMTKEKETADMRAENKKEKQNIHHANVSPFPFLNL